jgi:hypothetical protein
MKEKRTKMDCAIRRCLQQTTKIRLSELYHDLMPCCPLAQLAMTEAFDQAFHCLPLAMTKQTGK